MESVRMDPNFELVTLSNIGEGLAEEGFQDCLAVVMDVLENREKYVQTKDKETVIEVNVRLVFVAPQDGPLDVFIRAEPKRPKMIERGRQLFYKAGAFIQSKLRQADMFPSRPAKIRNPEPEEEEQTDD